MISPAVTCGYEVLLAWLGRTPVVRLGGSFASMLALGVLDS